jgi:hypothetical protein
MLPMFTVCAMRMLAIMYFTKENTIVPTAGQADAIEVTPTMARAGEEWVGEYDGKFVTATEIAIRTYRAMELVRREKLSPR